jgi:hypothetical protein
MTATENNLLAECDQMSESMLVRLEDWELAHLRAAMLNQVEQTLNEAITSKAGPTTSPHREAAGQPCPPGRGYCENDSEVEHDVLNRVKVSQLAETNR